MEELRRIKIRGGWDVTVEHLGYTKTLHFTEDAIVSEYDSRLLKIELNIQSSIDATKIETQYPSILSREEVEKTLIAKKYLVAGQRFEDLEIKQVSEVK